MSEAALSRYLRQIAASEGALIELIKSRVQAAVPEYKSFESQADEDEWTEVLRDLLRLFLELAHENRDFNANERERLRALGTKRAHQGIRQEPLRRSIRVAVSTARDSLIANWSPNEPDDLAAIQKLLGRMDAFWDDVQHLFVSGHEAADTETRFSPIAEGIARVVRECLDGGAADGDGAQVLFATGTEWRLYLAGRPGHVSALAAALPPGAVHAIPRDTPFPHVVVLAPSDERVAHEAEASTAAGGWVLLDAGPFTSLAELGRRHALGIPIFPYLSRLTDGGVVIAASARRMESAAAALDPAFRAALREDVLGALERSNRPVSQRRLDLLADLTRSGFRTTVVQEQTGRDKRTVATGKKALAEATGLDVRDPLDQLILGLCIAIRTIDG